MKVKELIEELQKLDPELRVASRDYKWSICPISGVKRERIAIRGVEVVEVALIRASMWESSILK